jgi:hypothetical protein
MKKDAHTGLALSRALKSPRQKLKGGKMDSLALIERARKWLDSYDADVAHPNEANKSLALEFAAVYREAYEDGKRDAIQPKDNENA